ncbi:MAG: hypothetical protein IPH27_12220 [Actinomycetales bacterium]|nr:hypothetical protein [Candidatus Phosphoribacter baldrii]
MRHLVRPLGGQIVLCLHDELLVHVPEGHSAAAVEVVHRALADSARRWVGASAGVPVRFVAEVPVIHRWDGAKN